MAKDRARDDRRSVGSLEKMGAALGFKRHSYKNYPVEAINDDQERRAVEAEAVGAPTSSFDRRGKVGNPHVKVIKGNN
jgi:hypothetical protein